MLVNSILDLKITFLRFKLQEYLIINHHSLYKLYKSCSFTTDKSLIVWQLTRGEAQYGLPNKRLCGHSHFVSDVVISSDGQFALSGSWDGDLRLWNLNALVFFLFQNASLIISMYHHLMMVIFNFCENKKKFKV